jgi:protein-histidine pros-kinase
MKALGRAFGMLLARDGGGGVRLTLLARLLSALTVVLALSGVALVWSIVQDEMAEQAQVLARRVTDEVRFAVPALSAPAIVGDFAAIEQMLRARAAQPFIEELVYRDARGHAIVVKGAPPALVVPESLRGFLRLPRLEEEGPIDEGGVNYGHIAVTVTPNYATNLIWRKVQHQVQFVVSTVASVLGIAFLVLVSGLAPLRRLTDGARRFGAGDHRARIRPGGPPETEESIRAFNRMADSIESALASLRASEERNRLLAMQVEQSQDAIFLVGSDGRVASWNAGATALFGRPAEGVLGRSAAGLGLLEASLRPQDAEGTASMPRRHEDFARNGAGQRVEVSVVTTPLLDDRGVRLGDLHVVRDISALKEVQAALAAANEGLERRVADRTRELERARDAAEAASRAKGFFLANMSHEIRTPLNGVLGISELLANTPLDADQRQFLELITSSGRSLLTVINDVLDFSKVEAGRVLLEEIEFAPVDCIGDAVKALAVSAHEKHLEVVFRVDPAVPALVRGDPSRVRQIVLNLLGNAVKFTQKGEVEVALGIAPSAASGASPALAVTVRDTGIGIPRDKQAIVFEAFSQADISTTRQFGGSGLGLTISAKLAELMHGAIRLESEPGRGSTFSVTLPLPFVTTTADASAPAMEPGRRVVVVDKNATAAAAMAQTLRAAGLDAVVVANARELAAARATSDFDMIVLDARSIAPSDVVPPPRVPVLVLSRLGSQAGAAGWSALGAVSHLAKPWKPRDLLDAARPLLAGHAAAAPAPLPVATVPAAAPDQPIRVLVAEDNTVNQFLARNLLQRLGCTVHLVASGIEAITAVEHEERFDLVLMDVQMPIMGGLEATEALRARERGGGRRLPIVALTANAVDGDRERCLGAGMDDYIAKPFSAAQLSAVIERWVRRPRQAQAAATASAAPDATATV